MQLIAEAYHLMKDGLGLAHSEMASILSDWNQGELDSFLIEITQGIRLRYLSYSEDDAFVEVETCLRLSKASNVADEGRPSYSIVCSVAVLTLI